MASIIFNGFNVGTDASLTISDAFGDIFPAGGLGDLMEFDSESEDTEIKIVPITRGGIPIYQTIWSGVRGHFMYTRVNGSLTNMIAELMTAYYTLGLIPQWSITLNVMNRDGTIDESMYLGVQWIRPRFGNFRATKEVDQRLEFRASQLITTGSQGAQLAGLAAAA